MIHQSIDIRSHIRRQKLREQMLRDTERFLSDQLLAGRHIYRARHRHARQSRGIAGSAVVT